MSNMDENKTCLKPPTNPIVYVYHIYIVLNYNNAAHWHGEFVIKIADTCSVPPSDGHLKKKNTKSYGFP